MKIKTILFLTAITTAATLATIPQYNIIPLAKLTDNPDEITQVWSINDAGQIAGSVLFTDDRTGSPILYQPGNYNTAIDLTPDPTDQRDLYVLNNNAGQLIGLERNDDGTAKIIIFDETGQGNNITIEEVGDFGIRNILSINDSGQIPGTVGSAALFNTSQPYSTTVFDLPQGYTSGTVYGVNNAGQGAGLAGFESTNGQYFEHAVLYEQDRVTSLGTLGGDNSNAFAINNSGQVVGIADNEQGQAVATIFDTTGQGNNISLGLLDSEITLPISINDNGQIVIVAGERFFGGGYSVYPTDIYLYDNSEIINLEDLIPEDAGWRIKTAWDINNLGQIIGWGYYNGQQHAFLMTPVPEPATLTILVIGALLIRRKKHIK